jgi:hypothetical protein
MRMQDVDVLLEEYVDGTRSNSRSFLQNQRELRSLLQDVSSSFARLISQPAIANDGATLFVAIAHSSYLAAMQLATGGQLPPSYMASRGVLEAALYGWYVTFKPELKAVWSARHQDEESKKLVKKSFKIVDMRDALRAVSVDIENQFSVAYDHTIDLGAHPNSLVMVTNLTGEDLDGNQTFQYVNLESEARNLAVQTAAHSGITALLMFCLAFRAQVRETSAPNEAIALQSRLSKMWGEETQQAEA